MTKEELIAQARVTAQTLADNMVRAYVVSVSRIWESYHLEESGAEGANRDDFLAWVEGYEWP